MGTPENITTRKYIKTKQKNKLTTNVIKSQQTANNEKYVKQKFLHKSRLQMGLRFKFQKFISLYDKQILFKDLQIINITFIWFGIKVIENKFKLNSGRWIQPQLAAKTIFISMSNDKF